MRIVIDARPFIKPLTGIGNFLKCFLKSLQKHRDIDIYILLPGRMDKSVDIVFEENVHLIECPLLGIKSIPRFIWFFIQVPIMLWKIKPDFFFSPITNVPLFSPKKVKNLIVVHDVINIEYEKTLVWHNQLYNRVMYKRGVLKADFLWANSYYTKGRVEFYYPHRKSSQIFVGAAVEKERYHRINLSGEEIRGLRAKYNIANRFILFVGSLEPRKNLQFLLKLMPYLHQQGIQLLVVGGKGWKCSNIKNLVNNSPEIQHATIFANYISNEELAKLYNIANCYVSTALNEGFGMPQLEALLCGCPVVTAHNSAMIEVVEGNGITVKGWDVKIWTDAILKAVVLPHRDYDLPQYDWDLIVERLLVFIGGKL